MHIKTTKELGNGLTQKKLASIAGIGTRFLSELERGKPSAQLGKTLMIANLLGLEIHINERR